MGMFGPSKLEATQDALRRARSNAAKWRATAEAGAREVRELRAQQVRKDELAMFNLTECRKLYDTTRLQLIESQKKMQALGRRLQLEEQETAAAQELVAGLQRQLKEREQQVAGLSAGLHKLQEQVAGPRTRQLPDGTPVTLSLFAHHTERRASKLDTKLRLRSMELGELRKSVRMLEEHNAQLQAREQRQAEAYRDAERRAGELVGELRAVEQELAECRAAADKPEPADMRRMVQEDLQRRVDAGTMTLAEARDAVRVQP